MFCKQHGEFRQVSNNTLIMKIMLEVLQFSLDTFSAAGGDGDDHDAILCEREREREREPNWSSRGSPFPTTRCHGSFTSLAMRRSS